MLDDIGRELRAITLGMLKELETAVISAGIRCYNVNETAGTIVVTPQSAGSRISRIIIRPIPLAMKVSVMAERSDSSSFTCGFSWGDHISRDLSNAVRKAMNGG